MKLTRISTLFALLLGRVISTGRTSLDTSYIRTTPPDGAIVVDNSGRASIPISHLTFQSAVDALDRKTTKAQNIFIYPGIYREQVFIPPILGNLTIQGYTADARSYDNNTVTITQSLALINTTADDLTATLRNWNSNTKVYNLNLANTFGRAATNGQSLAVSAHVGNQGYYGMQFLGFQDTILANRGSQLYAQCLIVGAVDFIYGQYAMAWFDQVDIRTKASGYITASGRDNFTNPSWFVINNSTVQGINSSIPAGSTLLGRPWRSFARVVFQNTFLDKVVKPEGWGVWQKDYPNTGNVTFAEYSNGGPGSSRVPQERPRANFSGVLSTSIKPETVLGRNFRNDFFVDLAYL
ncbi:pectin lyase fold/virulence factor [Tricladium varicosporioides]|nr:pectin lyase fold/virulence factor [Hymenoscyphus varicosporioides]